MSSYSPLQDESSVVAPISTPQNMPEETTFTPPTIKDPTLSTPPSLEKEMIRTTIYKIKDQLEILLQLFEGANATPPLLDFTPRMQEPLIEKGTRILEGIFTGEKMRSDDGEIFDVPANYASKSKLVAGDRMKLTIPLVGQFVYKQIAPVERNRIRGELISGNLSGQWLVSSEGRTYKVLTASVTFNKGRIGDEVVLLIPAAGNSEWGAIEHIIHKEL